MKPQGPYQNKKIKNPSGIKPDGLNWLSILAPAGSFFVSLLAYSFHQRDLAIGLGWGGVFNVFNFYSLKILTEKVLSRGEVEGQKFFWFWNLIRWIFLAVGCWWFLAVSPLCLAGAGASYFWFLVVLGLAGWRSNSPYQRKITD